jgi:ribose 5-phosphate isomerase B
MSGSSYDYPDAADEVARALLSGQVDQAVLICGTGIGVSIRANRYSGIRAAVCCSVETAQLARAHNHANVLCLGARTTSLDLATSIMRAFWEYPEDHDERHERRVRKLDGNVS